MIGLEKGRTFCLGPGVWQTTMFNFLWLNSLFPMSGPEKRQTFYLTSCLPHNQVQLCVNEFTKIIKAAVNFPSVPTSNVRNPTQKQMNKDTRTIEIWASASVFRQQLWTTIWTVSSLFRFCYSSKKVCPALSCNLRFRPSDESPVLHHQIPSQ